MLDLEFLNTDEISNPDECSSECFPFEESIEKALKDIKGRTPEELEKQWVDEDNNRQIESEDYMEYIEKIRSDLLDNFFDEEDNEYSSSEEIPTCNPWRD